MMQRSGPNMHFSFMRKLELEQGWVGEQEPGLHEFEKIGGRKHLISGFKETSICLSCVAL